VPISSITCSGASMKSADERSDEAGGVWVNQMSGSPPPPTPP
jgi:hypothetical protein